MTHWTHNIQLGHLKNFPFLQTNWNNIAGNGGKHKNWDLDGGEDSQLSLTDQLANVVGDMKVGRVADELDMLVAKVAEEVTDTVQTSVEMAGLKCVWVFMAVNILNCYI